MSWQQKLLKWYDRHKRDLPWRRTKDPYKIWVSEIMLQQTTVEAVIPYYERFLKKIPDMKTLAESSEEDVLKMWSGLGYYSRARNLWKASKILMETSGPGTSCHSERSERISRRYFREIPRFARDDKPQLPCTVESLMNLPGIGRYTAGAIASIAFNQRAPIVDGNVIRVLSRLFRISVDPKSSKGQKKFWKKAEDILNGVGARSTRPGGQTPPLQYGDFNQSLMELGATVCLPENPLCLICPVQKECQAHHKGQALDFPKGKKKTIYHDVILTAAVIQKQGQILMVQRGNEGVLKNFWEFPMVEGDLEMLAKNWPVKILKPLPSVRHSVLNRRLKIFPFLCELTGEKPKNRKYEWIGPHEIHNLPSSSMNRKILEKFRYNE